MTPSRSGVRPSGILPSSAALQKAIGRHFSFIGADKVAGGMAKVLLNGHVGRIVSNRELLAM